MVHLYLGVYIIPIKMSSNRTPRQTHWLIGYDGVSLTSQNCGLYGPIVHPRVTEMWTMHNGIDWG
jgi:hypothetical protein